MDDMLGFRRLRLLSLALVGVALFGLLGYRLVALQIFDRDWLTERARNQQEREFTLAAPRGSLIDRNGVVLARNGDSLSLYAVPKEVTDVGSTARRLARLVDLPARTLRHKLTARRQFVWITRQQSMDLLPRLTELDLPGIYWQAESCRYYLRGDAFQSALGLVGIDDVGLEGLEYRYDRTLRGESGRFLRRRDGRRRPVADWVLRAPREGADLILTLDEVVQHTAYTALKRGVEEAGAACGVAVVADPSTGEILAMADYGLPADAKRAGAGRKYRSNAVTWQFEPGSIFKPAVVAVALERNLTDRNALVFAENGSYQVADRTFHEASGHQFDWLSTAQVLQRSSNIGMIKLVDPIDGKVLYRYLEAFGFGAKSGIDYPGEACGLLRPPGEWSAVSKASIAIGQEIAVTPLQMVTLYNSLANGGLRVTPRLVRAIDGPHPVARERLDHGRPQRVISPATAHDITEMLKGVVGPKGTAPKAAVEGFAVAGKTGTAQKFDREAGQYSRTRYVSSFIGYVPADHPRLTILVTIDEPRGGAYGGQVAGPIFREIAEKTLRHLGVQPDPGPRILKAAAPPRPPRLSTLTL
jgi:cell division protein FtsI (penicillin-binding protein 3)